MTVQRTFKSVREIPLVITVQEAAAAMHTSSSGVYRLVASGELPSFRVGHKRRIYKRHLLAFMRAHRIRFS